MNKVANSQRSLPNNAHFREGSARGLESDRDGRTWLYYRAIRWRSDLERRLCL